jgi:alanine racemase
MRIISYRETWAEISLDSISHNTQTFKSNLHESCRLMAVIKADGYGHGAVEVARTAIKAGADFLGVAFLDEALQLRDAGIDIPILVLGYTPPYSVEMAVLHDITLSVFSHDVANALLHCSKRLNKLARVHLKVDTGMTRIGVTEKEEALTLARKIMSTPFLFLEGIFTHFADADNQDSAYTHQQFQLFTSFIHFLESCQIKIPVKHCCNSAATINFPEMHLDMVRVGISLYGLPPSLDMQHDRYPLEQAMHFKTKVASLKFVPKNQAIGYGCTFKPTKDSLIATIPVGYADGLSRSLSNSGTVLVRDIRVPIVGRVCMDQAMIDVTSIPYVKVGDEVILFGGSKNAFIPIHEIAGHMNTIGYEVVCLIGKRVPRVFIKNGMKTEVKNHFVKTMEQTT